MLLSLGSWKASSTSSPFGLGEWLWASSFLSFLTTVGFSERPAC